MAFASVYPHYIASTGDGQRRTGLCGQDSADLPVTQDLAADALGQERLSVAEGQFVDPVGLVSQGWTA